MPAKKTATTKATTSKATTKRSTAKKSTARRTTSTGSSRKSTATASVRARRGDRIVIDSPQVGSPPREGEVMKVIVGEVSVSYRVKWPDGHETLISPVAGTARIVRT